MNAQEFLKNRIVFPPSDLLNYVGRWVAFDERGLSIVAAANTMDGLEAELAKTHIDPQTVHFEYIPGPGEDDFVNSPETVHEVPVPK
jgi:hypothetical protein